MTDHDSNPDSPLIDGLASLPDGSFRSPLPPDGLREMVLAGTLQFVRRRALRRRLGAMVAGVALYALGYVTHLARMPSTPEPELPGATPAIDSPTSVLREVAMAAPADRARLLKQAGDTFLARDGDLERALDCYRQVLEISPTTELPSLTVGEGDTWLWMSLKQGQQLHHRR